MIPLTQSTMRLEPRTSDYQVSNPPGPEGPTSAHERRLSIVKQRIKCCAYTVGIQRVTASVLPP